MVSDSYLPKIAVTLKLIFNIYNNQNISMIFHKENLLRRINDKNKNRLSEN